MIYWFGHVAHRGPRCCCLRRRRCGGVPQSHSWIILGTIAIINDVCFVANDDDDDDDDDATEDEEDDDDDATNVDENGRSSNGTNWNISRDNEVVSREITLRRG